MIWVNKFEYMDFPAHEPIFEIPFPIDQESVNYIKIEMGPSSDRYFLSNDNIDAEVLCYFYIVMW